VETGNFLPHLWKPQGNSMETESLKALALKVLHRNQKGNSVETKEKKHGNSEGEKFPLRKAYKIFSEILQEHLWVVETDQDMKALRSQGNTEAIYTLREIPELKKIPRGDLKAIHNIKETFPESTIEEVKNRLKNIKEEK
jgi:hypothetical protein